MANAISSSATSGATDGDQLIYQRVNLGWLSLFAFLKAARKVGALPIR